MPYCPNCGDSVKETHRYCGQCGQPLSEEVQDDEGRPPRSSAAGTRGFLSGRSLEYVGKVRDGELEWDSEAIGYAHLKRDIGNALADFQMLSNLDELNLLELVLAYVDDGELSVDIEKMNYQEQRRMLGWLGLFSLPGLYDQSFGTEWEDELQETLDELIQEVQAEID